MKHTPKDQRLSQLGTAPIIAGMDHRHFLDNEGKDVRFKSLSRQERRKITVGSRRIAREYKRIINNFSKSGMGFPIDNLLRELCLEYTNRYANAGYYSQPINFNYFEPFCNIGLIENSLAPFAEPLPENDHLFSIIDYLDYITSSDGANFNLSELKELPSGKIFHFTTSGDHTDFTFLTPEGREFVVSGFSMVRHDYLINWYLVGGEILSNHEWEEKARADVNLETDDISPYKRRFLEQSREKNEKKQDPPVALEGTKTAIRTAIAGETDLNSRKHVGRCYMSEREKCFLVVCDDPDVFSSIPSCSKRDIMIEKMHEQVESAAVLWNLAEAMFQLPAYFLFNIEIQKSVLAASGRTIGRGARGGRGVGANYRKISSIEITDKVAPLVTTYTLPYYQVETEGYWRRLHKGDWRGHGPDGEPVLGRTWVKASNKWRERPDRVRTIFVKSSVAAARVTVNKLIEIARNVEQPITESPLKKSEEQETRGVLYVLRCTAMKDGIYKVGWTSGSAENRAKELSSATGVPSSYVVVDYWCHSDAKALETCVHAILDPYRVNENREFFQSDYIAIKRLIETEIERINRKRINGDGSVAG